MTHKIIMTAGYPEMADKISRVSDELGLNVLVVEGILREAAREVKKAVDLGDYEVIVSRAGTAKEISKLVNLPIVYSDSDHFDILTGFIQAKKLGEKICFITYPEEGYFFNFDKIKEIIGFDVTILPYTTQEELIDQIRAAKEMGIDVVVGGGIRAATVAKNFGLKTMNLSISERSIKRILLLADKVAKDRMLIKRETEIINSVLNSSEEGILYINEHGVIESCNKKAELIFNIKENDVKNKSLKEINHKDINEILDKRDSSNTKGNYTVGSINVTFEPVNVDYKKIGTVITVREISKVQKLESKIRIDLHKKGLLAKYSFNDVIHCSPKMKRVVNLAEEYSLTESTILIIGESGTGKELIAQSIHNASDRKKGPFVAINCAALPENLLESELFGYSEGAFTGANKGGRQGVFELAHGGTIFLDEIGEISPHIQTRLLRVLQEREVMRIGGDRIIPVNIRVIAATNQRLWELVQSGKFRLDLYFRLSVLHLEIPPLRQRKEDIPLYINHFFNEFQSDKNYDDLSDDLKMFFMKYEWPGNVRQLENIIERYCLSIRSRNTDHEFIAGILNETATENPAMLEQDSIVIKHGTIKEMETEIITKMLHLHDDNKSLVAEKLGISRTTLWKRLNE